MPYEDLTIDERIAFHGGIIAKHRECQRRLQMACETEEERLAQSAKVATLMARDVAADEFKAVEEVKP